MILNYVESGLKVGYDHETLNEMDFDIYITYYLKKKENPHKTLILKLAFCQNVVLSQNDPTL